MASLKPCPTCGKDVATDATKCPHCGTVIEQKGAALVLVIMMLTPILLFAGFVLYRFG